MPKSVEGVMHEFKTGALHSGSKQGPVVKNRKQAIAIALSEQRQKGSKVKAKAYGSGPFSEAEKKQGFKVCWDANDLNTMDVDRRENVPDEFVLAERRESNTSGHAKRRNFRRSESTKGEY